MNTTKPAINPPTLGKTVNEVHAAWLALCQQGFLAIGRDIGNGGMFDYRADKEIWRVFDTFDPKRVPTCRKATTQELDDIDDSIQRGFFQIEQLISRRQRQTRILHQSTGRPIC